MNSSASAPSATTCKRPVSAARSNACVNNSTSAALSSTSRISTVSSGMCGHFSQGEIKRRAFFRLGFGPDAAAVAGNGALHDGQAHARALELLGAMQPLEHAEKFAGVFHVEARAVVFHEVSLF